MNNWKEFKCKTWAFNLDDEPKVIYVIEGCGTSSSGRSYIVVHEDALGLTTGKTEISNKEEIEKKYKLKLN